MIENLKKSQNIGIIVADHKNLDFVAVALVLFFIAKKFEKHVYYNLNKNLEIFPLLEANPQIVLTTKKQLSDVSYEKNDEGIKLFLTPQDKDMTLDDLNFELINAKGNITCDLIITIGFKNLKSLENISLFNAEKARIINIDNNQLNKNFGGINLVENGSSLSKILFKNLDECIMDEKIASILLSGVKEGELGTIQKLAERGGKFETKDKFKSLISTINKIEYEGNIYFAELEDLEESHIPFILQVIKTCLFVPDFILILKNKKCVFYLQNEETLEKIKTTFEAQVKNDGGIFSKENISKKEILNILK